VRIDRGRGAKPEIRGTDALYFNATASGTTALVAISGAEVGIDIERVDDRSDIKSLAGRWLSTEERSHVDRLPRRERPRALFACLTKKEAVLKAAGVGLGLDPSVVSIPSGGDGPVEVPTLPPSSWWVRPLTLGRSLVGGLATTRPAPTVTRFVLRDLSGTRTALS
jgi:4'-phosphopantetheinyl transferase